MPDIWYNSYNDNDELASIELFYPTTYTSDEYAQSPEDGVVILNNRFVGLSYTPAVMSEPVPTINDANSQLGVHVPFIPHTSWQYSSFPDIPRSGGSNVFPTQYSFEIPQKPAFPTEIASSSSHLYNNALVEPIFTEHYPAEQDPQSQRTQAVALNPSVVVPNDQLVEPSKRITVIMTSFKVLPHQDTTNQNVEIFRAEKALNEYLSSLPPDVYSSIENRRRSHARIGAPSGRTHSTTRRKNAEEKGLFLCLWCRETITTKNNVANHIRSHLNIRLSFCNNCNFSSVTSKLPVRHQCGKLNGNM